MGYDVFVGRIGAGERIHQYDDPEIEKALLNALGTPWEPPPRFPQAFSLRKEGRYPYPAADADLTLKELGINLRSPSPFTSPTPFKRHRQAPRQCQRLILTQLGCSPPWEDALHFRTNNISEAGLHALCREFGLSYPPDMRFKGQSTESDEYGVLWRGAYYTSTHKSRAQYNWFCPKRGLGLTKVGLGRLNRSIEGFVYSVVVAQASTRTNIVDKRLSGGAVETQRVFASLFEDALKETIPSSVRRFQRTVIDGRTRLDLAISPGLWLLPSHLVINRESVFG
ncbi:hypothetical protein QZH41_000495 [Actinostola sp. cb2023]|nr:hypothetical protein QZH41_000495 [Actinostola sp. cb2023]